MGEVDRSVCDGNILCFADQLRWETNSTRQETLKRLLLREENRFGVSEEHFRIAERKLMDGEWLIARQKQLIAEIKSRKGDTASAERTLRNFEMIQELFERLRDRAYDERERRRH
jgi:predicted component of type VI protein secretion system